MGYLIIGSPIAKRGRGGGGLETMGGGVRIRQCRYCVRY